MKELYTEDEIIINAPKEVVWEALTNPKITPKYMFGCRVACSWVKGSEVLWIGEADHTTYVKGTLVEYKEQEIFSFTTFDPTAEYEDILENYLTATYTLVAGNQSTLLKVTQGDYSSVADGTKRYEDTLSQGGWSAILKEIKNILEE